MLETKASSLRDSLIDSIGHFLYKEGFKNDEITTFGVLEIINLISDYHEEGKALFPEIFVTNSLDFLKTIPNKEIVISETELTVQNFKHAIKLCAPLASNRWIIFIEVKDKRMTFGITSAEMTETSPSMYYQTVGQLKVDDYKGITIAYIRNIGQKTVELAGLKNRLIVSLTLDPPKEIALNEIQSLCENISQRSDEKYRVTVKSFFEKHIDEALKTGHGNLIGVVDDDVDTLIALKTKIPGKGGIYLLSPIDFETLIIEAEENKNGESSVNLRSHASLLKSMLNHDGITIISNKGRIIGYHILIDDFLKEGDKIDGATRSKAFKSMENCGLFQFCFYKSQDGNLKTWQKR